MITFQKFLETYILNEVDAPPAGAAPPPDAAAGAGAAPPPDLGGGLGGALGGAPPGGAPDLGGGLGGAVGAGDAGGQPNTNVKIYNFWDATKAHFDKFKPENQKK